MLIALHNPTFQQTVRLGGATQPLAYDLSAPLGHYPRASAPILAVRGLLRADKVTQRTGLYIVEPYDSSRIPVVLVHGLLSTLPMWLNIMNAVRADPQLRTRYQFWVFYYPTANPGALSSWALRNDLAAAERLAPRTIAGWAGSGSRDPAGPSSTALGEESCFVLPAQSANFSRDRFVDS